MFLTPGYWARHLFLCPHQLDSDSHDNGGHYEVPLTPSASKFRRQSRQCPQRLSKLCGHPDDVAIEAASTATASATWLRILTRRGRQRASRPAGTATASISELFAQSGVVSSGATRTNDKASATEIRGSMNQHLYWNYTDWQWTFTNNRHGFVNGIARRTATAMSNQHYIIHRGTRSTMARSK